MMKLKKFRLTEFRSIHDSGWVEMEDMAVLIGTNESGKTNLLVGLWKLSPANEGEIDLIADLPRLKYHELRDTRPLPVFVRAVFDPGLELRRRLTALTGLSASDLSEIEVARDFGGAHHVAFPQAARVNAADGAALAESVEAAEVELSKLTTFKKEDSWLSGLLARLAEFRSKIPEVIDGDMAEELRKVVIRLQKPSSPARKSEITPKLKGAVSEWKQLLSGAIPREYDNHEEAQELVLSKMPSFVYYSQYGNLDSEIYLPHVLQNLKRTDLGVKDAAKARTLRVLFDFVNLAPDEIRQLGQSPKENPSRAEIDTAARKTKERGILLQSASSDLTARFREWWRQGDYKFRFQADGDHFRIWVSDDRRPEEVELEGRSAGLQWFFSFFLVFLVESQLSHKDAILLLDEPGLTLHPVAQEDLATFFDELSSVNQLVFTTHSPFVVDPNHLDRVHAVYVGKDGQSEVSQDLRAGQSRSEHSHSIYPVFASLGLSVSRSLLLGCDVVIVEGVSDMYLLSAMKQHLVATGLVQPQREVVFVPGGGVRGVKTVATIFAGRNGTPPPVLLDSDKPGKEMAKHLTEGHYSGCPERVLLTDDYCLVIESEIEDLWPASLMADLITRHLRGPAEEFEEVHDAEKPIVPQAKAYAREHGIVLTIDWKVQLAEWAKPKLLATPSLAEPCQEQWAALFNALLGD